jgi:hypothetical protein
MVISPEIVYGASSSMRRSRLTKEGPDIFDPLTYPTSAPASQASLLFPFVALSTLTPASLRVFTIPSVSAFVRRARVFLSSRGFGSPNERPAYLGYVRRRVEKAEDVQLRRPALLHPEALGPPPCNRTEMAGVLFRQSDKAFERSAHRIWIFFPGGDEIAVHLIDATHLGHATKEPGLVFVGQL